MSLLLICIEEKSFQIYYLHVSMPAKRHENAPSCHTLKYTSPINIPHSADGFMLHVSQALHHGARLSIVLVINGGRIIIAVSRILLHVIRNACCI
jgi:hypothetical protein